MRYKTFGKWIFKNLNLYSKRKNDQFINIKNAQVSLKEIKMWVFANLDCSLSFFFLVLHL